jgi:subtilisin-like proprotein convertase family protein
MKTTKIIHILTAITIFAFVSPSFAGLSALSALAEYGDESGIRPEQLTLISEITGYHAVETPISEECTYDSEFEVYLCEEPGPVASMNPDPVARTQLLQALHSTGLLLIPDSTNDRVMAFDPLTGDLIDPNFVPSNAVVGTGIHAILSASGNSILLSDQIGDVVHEFDLDGNYLGIFAPAGGANTDIMDNIRGIALRPNGNLLVTVASGANADSIAEFDTSGNYLGNFISNSSGGLDSPFDVYQRPGVDWLVGGIDSDLIHRYHLDTGAFLDNLAPINTFPEQIFQANNSNVLVANFSGTQEGLVEFNAGGGLLGVYNPAGIGGYRGVYELPNGNLLTTTGAGVFEIDRSGNLVDTKISGVSSRFVEYVSPNSQNVMTRCSTPGVPIPDLGQVSDTINITEDFPILDLNVYINATHTWVGDLSFNLFHISDFITMTNTLIDRPGVPASTFGCSGDNYDVTVDDEGVNTPIENQCSGTPPAIRGRAPGGDPPNPSLLAPYNGLSTHGDWTLTVTDHAEGDSGTLVEWCLDFTYPSPSIELTKTVGVLPGVCADTDEITVVAGTEVYYCYQAENTGDLEFNFHELVDSELGTILYAFPYTLTPGTLSPQVIVPASPLATVTNEATWTAVTALTEYSVDDTIPYNWNDISATGTPVVLGDDQVSSAIPLGFVFNFYGENYTDIYISSNGFLTVLPDQPNGCCTGGILPSPTTPNGVIAGWWEDLNPSIGGTIHYQTFGTAPNRYFIVQFTDVPHYGGGNLVTKQYKLYENNKSIEVHYQAAPSDGGTHSAGIENATGTSGVQYYRGTSSLPTPLAVRYAPAIRLEASASATATVNVLLPQISIEPNELMAAQGYNQITTQILEIANIGTGDLEWTIVEEPTAVLSTPTRSGTSAVAVDVFDPSEKATQQAGIPAPLSDWTISQAVLYDNGSLVTHPDGGAGGADASALQTSLGLDTFGFGHQISAGNRIADDFTVAGSGWFIETITFFAYQTGSGTDSTITEVNLRIWDGPPDDPTSMVVFGDTTTNRLIDSQWSNIYRVLDTNLLSTDRPVMANLVEVNTFLPPGTYWLDWQVGGTLPSGPWAPPISILGETTTGDALQYTSTGWAAVTDNTFPQGFPFIISGLADCTAPSDVPWLSVNPDSGITASGEISPVTVTFDSTGLAVGTYTANLCVISNEIHKPVTVVPVELTVFTPAFLQVAHLAPFAEDASVTITLNGEPTLTDFAYGDSTGYITLPIGAYDVSVIPDNPTFPAFGKSITLEADNYYTAIAVGNVDNQTLELLLLEDNLTAPVVGKFHLRLGHLTPFASGLATADIRLQDGNPVLLGVNFGDVTGFIPLDAGTYDLKITTPGGEVTLIDPLPVDFVEGTIISAFAAGEGVNQDLGVFTLPAGVEGFFLPLYVEPEPEEFFIFMPVVFKN